MIHVFHGFLGSPEDFLFLQREDVLLHDLYKMDSLPQVSPDDTLIGYSMGGRIALEIAHQNQYHLKKIILINAHPGLETQAERSEREIFENKVQEHLEGLSQKDFMKWWNALPVFAGDNPISTTHDRFEKSPYLFEDNRLSKQKYFLPHMNEHKEKFLYVVGKEDIKYMELALGTIAPMGIKVKTMPGGHRAFQRGPELMKVLNEEGIL